MFSPCRDGGWERIGEQTMAGMVFPSRFANTEGPGAVKLYGIGNIPSLGPQDGQLADCLASLAHDSTG